MMRKADLIQKPQKKNDDLERLWKRLPIYGYLQEKSVWEPKKEDPETYEKIVQANEEYLEGKVLDENQELVQQEAQKEQEEKQKEEELQKEKEEKEEPIPDAIDFDTLHAISKDAVAWLYALGGGINYVVAQAGDNDYYLHRLLNGAEAKAGTLFMDYQNHSDFSDWNTMIYGHHMKNGTMFASLVKYQDQEYYEKHPVMYLYTPGQRMKLEILAGYTTDIEDSVYTIPTSKEGRDELVKHVLQKSNFTSKASVTGEDKLVTLSTCTYEYEDARFVVIGKIAE